ncbi:MAG: ABC transporter permease [Cognatishimia sp.]|jgi:fructose transport system permease protein|nr:ABC transporter permease [Paracoccaceae bacterium]MCH2248224.1 ABC transporter permease [Cognatishimia sp.]
MATNSDNFEDAIKSRSEESVADFDHHEKGVVGFIHETLHKYPFFVPLIVMIVAIIVFGLINPNFYRVNTLSVILQQVGIVGILGTAQAIVILTAGIDLSVGAIMVFTTVIMGQFSFRYGIPAEITIIIGIAAAGFMGFCNGWLVARLRLPPFIVTLGTWQIILAANFIYSRNETIRSQDIAAEASALQFWGTIFKIGDARVTYGVIAFLVLVAIMAYVLSSTAWGRHVYAVGDDPEAAELAGVNKERVLIQVYTLAGILCGIAGWVAIGRFGAISPGASTGVQGNIQSITAVVIGGISLFGGRGSIIGMFLGALIVGVFEMGLRMAGADAQWTFLLIGVLIIAAVTIDQWIRKVAA